MNLLEKSRRINAMLQQTGAKQVDFMEMAESLSEVIEANVFILSRHGRVLGFHIGHNVENERLKKMLEDHQFPEEYTENLYYVRETRSNIGVEDELTAIPIENIEFFRNVMTTIVPVFGSNERLGTLVLARFNGSFEDGDIIIAEFGATVVGMEILRERAEQQEEEARSKAIVQMAMSSLSFSELEAIEHIFAELQENEGLLVASKIADRAGITRSVIVNALRKLESAGVIESRSLGMKGTFIRILNENFHEQLLQMKHK